jgi:hypothetical protein
MMRMRLSAIGVVLAGLLYAGPAQAQQAHVADVSTMRQAMAKQVQTDTDNRAVIARVLKQQPVRDAAKQMGVNLDKAERGLTTLTSSELASLASSARNIERDLAGGDTVITISVVTLLLLLILIVLIVD